LGPPDELLYYSEKTRSFPECDTVIGHIYDDNVCACAISALISLPVVTEDEFSDVISYMSW